MTKTINDVIDFATNQVTVEHGTVAQDKVVAGVVSDANTKITMQTYHHYSDPCEQFLLVFGIAV